MKYLVKTSFILIVLSIFLFAGKFAALAGDSGIDFFGARVYGSNKPSFFVIKPGDFDGDGKVDAMISGLQNVMVYFGDGSGKFSAPVSLIENFSGIPLFPVAGDFNGDGRSDIAVRASGLLRVYLGNSDKTFAPPVLSGGDPLPQYMEVVDFDSDGKADLVGGGSGSGGNAISFYKGAGDGSFAYIEKIDTQYQVLPIISDFNNDSRPDIMFTNNDAHRVSLNIGGHFGNPVAVNIDPLVSLQGVGDFNGDGLKDVVSTDGTINPYITIWLGAANLTFSEGQDEQIISNERIFLKDIADVDNDQKPDLIFNSLNRTFIKNGLGNGTFTLPTFYGESGNGDLFAKDLNGDGWLDIVAAQPTEFAVPGSGGIAVLLNLQNGGFESAPAIATGSGTIDIAISDLNGDQLKDFVVVNDGSAGGDVVVIFQIPGFSDKPEFSISEILSADKAAGGNAGIDPNAVTIGDFTQDGRPDIIVIGRAITSGQNALLLRNLGNNSFASTFFPISTGEIYGLETADFNSDGKLDLVTISSAGVLVLFGNGNGTFGTPVNYLSNASASRITIGDVNNDAKPDIIASTNNSNFAILLNNGSGTFTNTSNPAVMGELSGVAVADMNSDGVADLIGSKSTIFSPKSTNLIGSELNGVAVLLGNNNGTFNSEMTYPITQGPVKGLVVSDLNGDGKPDAALSSGTNSVTILLNNGFGGLGGETIWSGGVTMRVIVAGDLNNDQKNDLIAGYTTSDDGYTKVLFNETVTTPAGRSVPFDFDGDRKTDISIFRPAPGEWWYLKSSDGGNAAFQFGQSSDVLTPADFTGDGKTDIAFWRESSGEWFILRSENSSFFSFPFGTSGDIPAPGDFDGDGKADPAIFRPTDSTWYILNSGGGTTIQQFGLNGDFPIAQDFDGDGKDDLAIFRPSVGEWYYQRSSDGQVNGFQFGTPTDKPIPADYTGDGKTDVAFWRPNSGEWFILRSEDNSFFAFPFGTTGDIPVPGDYDGDGTADAAVFRPSNNIWFLNQSTNGSAAIQFGIASDIPIPSAYIP